VTPSVVPWDLYLREVYGQLQGKFLLWQLPPSNPTKCIYLLMDQVLKVLRPDPAVFLMHRIVKSQSENIDVFIWYLSFKDSDKLHVTIIQVWATCPQKKKKKDPGFWDIIMRTGKLGFRSQISNLVIVPCCCNTLFESSSWTSSLSQPLQVSLCAIWFLWF
jgi:hypothetical protein